MGKRRNALAAVTLFGLLANFAHADRIILQDGKLVEGEVIQEDDKSVTVETAGVGVSLTRQIKKSKIKTWQKQLREGKPYVVVPVIGVIGDDITVDALRAGLAEARAARPQYVILEIDSPGGNVGQMMEMVEVLNDASRDLKIIAYVKSAYSAAAVIAMSCPQVYMKAGATIGATVAFRMTENGPTDVDAKFRSVVEARMRAANQHGSHADLLIRGMSESDLTLYLADKDGRLSLSTSGPGKLIKGKGQILTLTADEAVECGLAHVAPTMTDLGRQVCGGAWYEVNRRAFNTTIGTVARQKERELEAVEQSKRLIARQNAISEIKPQWDNIERHVAELSARAVANGNAIADLTAKSNQELQQINIDYLRAVIDAKYQSDPKAAIARAIEVAQARASALRQYLQANVAKLQADGQAAQVEIGLMRAKQRQLLATIPTD